MIDDLRAARPQSGLSSASVVWQAPAEGGIPRYMAIFQDTMPKSIGPVRSSRYYYIAWAAEWRAIYAHSGGSPGALQTLRAKGSGQYVYNVDEFRYSGTFHRLKTRFSPHNLYTTSAKLRNLGKKIGAKDKAYKTVWQFAPDAPLEARPYGGTITVKYPYNTITYKYDRKTNTYLRIGDRREEADRRRQRHADRAEERGRSCGCASVRSTTAIPERRASKPRSSAAGRPGSRPTAGRSRAPGRRPSVTKPTKFYDADGQGSHAHGRPDLRPGHHHEHDRLPDLVQGGLRHAAGDPRPERVSQLD